MSDTTMKSLNDQMKIRYEKMISLKEEGYEPFGKKYSISHKSKDIHDLFEDKDIDQLEEINQYVTIAGRLMTKRRSGKLTFADIKDRTGIIQVFIQKNSVGEEKYEIIKKSDLGDILGFGGTIMKSKAGELSIKVDKVEHLSKALRPLPDKYHGLTDVEMKYRKRYLDLISNDDTMTRFINRSKIISGIRNYLDNKDYIEVETPILINNAGGASAKPFITHHNSLNVDMYMRIATELSLKRLIVGGMEKVYEIGRIFRNEGMDTKHNPEFTTLELYAAYLDFEDIMTETENIFKAAAKAINKKFEITYQDKTIDISKPFQRKHIVDLIKEKTGIDFWNEINIDQARELASDNGIKIEKYWAVGHIIAAFFDKFVESTLDEPTFVYGFPTEVSPLAKKNKKDSRFTDRFELYILGNEYANAFTELNDPIDQKERFINQLKEKESGNEEASGMDDDYIEALEYGMAPTGGLGIGIDRLVMLLTDAKSIRDVLLFPTMK